MTDRQTLGVILGGASVEHTISVRSARAVIAAADPERFRVIPFAVSRNGHWLTPDASRSALTAIDFGAAERIADPPGQPSAPIPPATIAALLQCDAVFPLIHGASGEDGVLQGFLEMLDLAYVGPGVEASAIAMDKARCKQLLSMAGIPVAPSITVRVEDWRSSPTAQIRAAAGLGFPLFLKPSRGGSSIGISRVDSREDLPAAFDAAVACDSEVLVEQAMPNAREIECGILGSIGADDADQAIASSLGEIRTQRRFYDYTAKYEDPATELLLPAELDHATAEQLRRTALDAYYAIGASGLLRADFLLADSGPLAGQFWLGELNTIPGFTSASMYPRLFEVDGIPLQQLVERLVDLALHARLDRIRQRQEAQS